MSETEMLMVFCYDVTRDKVRRRVAGVLEEAATRVQRSVFEARMTTRAARALARRAAAEMDPEDSFRLYAVGASGQPHCWVQGGAPLAENQAFWLV